MSGAAAALDPERCRLCGHRHTSAELAAYARTPARVLPWRERRPDHGRPPVSATPPRGVVPTPARGMSTWGRGGVSTPARGVPAHGSAAHRIQYVERPRTVSFGFPLSDMAPRRARRHTVDFARLWGMDDLVETAQLVVSELMTNALEASRQSGGSLDGVAVVAAPLELRLTVEHRRLRIEVRDHSPQAPVMDDPDFDNERGRGLLLVDTFSEVWGYRRLPAGGKVVWCVISPGKPA